MRPDREILDAALRQATAAALRGPLVGANPRVGCVIIDAQGNICATGYHRGAGTAHAEVAALAAAGDVQGGTAVVTLEPCAHTGRTGPCVRALAEAGITQVIYAVADSNPAAAGGAQWLRDHGIAASTATAAGCSSEAVAAAAAVSEQWRIACGRQYPWVIAKTAMSADGFVAAADGTSQWITAEESRKHAHQIRSEVDAIIVGTTTALVDNPRLTARNTSEHDSFQPLRVVIGCRDLPENSQLAQSGYLAIRHHDLKAALAQLYTCGCSRVLIEGGPTVVSAAIAAGLVDMWHVYRAPLLLGAGTPALTDLGVSSISTAVQLLPVASSRHGSDDLTVYAVSEEAKNVYRAC